ncbi:MAG TPA: uracil-DNA glycosylase [Candidatus Tectomicrobia bacterium]|nr:uracil-DNA glycosylase [Candidatus Tectomicrobia bacterium]
METSRTDKQHQMDALRTQALTCPGCPNKDSRLRVVFGEGDVNARVMLVGQGPGVIEEQTGRPFAGPSGRLLDQALAEVGLERGKLWLTNVIKCRALRSEKGRVVDRAPSAAELKACRPWLDAELGIIQPEIIVCIGVPAAKALIDRKFKLSEEHGQFREDRDGTRRTAIFHPAYVLRLRSVDQAAYERTWRALVEDLRAVAAAV